MGHELRKLLHSGCFHELMRSCFPTRVDFTGECIAASLLILTVGFCFWLLKLFAGLQELYITQEQLQDRRAAADEEAKKKERLERQLKQNKSNLFCCFQP